MKTINYSLDGGKIEKGETLVEECGEFTSRIIPSPSKRGYIFVKWVDDNGRVHDQLLPSRIYNGMTLFAIYEVDANMRKGSLDEGGVAVSTKVAKGAKPFRKEEPEAEESKEDDSTGNSEII